MDARYEIFAETGFIRAAYAGRMEYDTCQRMIQDIVDTAVRTECRKLFVDVRRVVFTYSHVTPIRLAQDLLSLGVDENFRIAVLGVRADSTIIEFGENVAVNRGLPLKIFFEEDEALKWLLSEAK